MQPKPGFLGFPKPSPVSPIPGLVLLARGKVANVASLDVVMTEFTAYKNKKLKVNSISPVTAGGANLAAFVSANGGASYDSGAASYMYHDIGGSQSTSVSHTSGTDNSIFLASSVSAQGASIELEMLDTPNAEVNPKFFARVLYRDVSPNMISKLYQVSRLAAQKTDAVQIAFSGTNIASGTWELYGYN